MHAMVVGSNDAQLLLSNFKQQRAFVTSLKGKVRRKETFSKYPEFKDANTCSYKMALILKTEKRKFA